MPNIPYPYPFFNIPYCHRNSPALNIEFRYALALVGKICIAKCNGAIDPVAP